MTLQDRQDAALQPVRAALISQACEQAAQTVAGAARTAEASLTSARRDADTAVARATADGGAEAELAARADIIRAKRAAQSVALGAEAATREYLTRRIRRAVLALHDEADYPLLRHRLSEMTSRAAGPGAVVVEHPDGGVMARAPGIVVDCSLGRLADRAIAILEPRIAALCAGSQPPHADQDSG